MKWISECLRQQFAADGYTVVRGVVPQDLIAPAIKSIIDFIGADLDNPKSWYGGHAVNDGIVPVHHAQAVWDIRQCQPIYEAFSEFWGTSRLMVDINRSCFRPPIHSDWPTVSCGEIHWDADPRADRAPSLQAIVLLTDVGQDAGGFQCMPDIYRNLKFWLAEHAASDEFSFLRPGIAQEGATQISGNAGDLVLWSTLLPHGPAPNHSAVPRIATFMTLAPPADEESLRSDMTQWWLEKRAPTYWRNMVGLQDPEPGSPAVLTTLGKQLIGAVPWVT